VVSILLSPRAQDFRNPILDSEGAKGRRRLCLCGNDTFAIWWTPFPDGTKFSDKAKADPMKQA